MRAEQVAQLSVRRFHHALACLCALILVVAGSGLVERALSERVQADAAEAIGIPELRSEADPFAALDAMEESIEPSSEELPSVFQDEMGLLPDAHDLRIYAEGGVISYQVDGLAEDILASLEERCAEQGWNSVPLGGCCGATFMKSTGELRWALVTCSQIEETTTVVVRIQR